MEGSNVAASSTEPARGFEAPGWAFGVSATDDADVEGNSPIFTLISDLTPSATTDIADKVGAQAAKPAEKANNSPFRNRDARRRVPRGFTLLELLVVSAIIGVVIGLLLLPVQKIREQSRPYWGNPYGNVADEAPVMHNPRRR